MSDVNAANVSAADCSSCRRNDGGWGYIRSSSLTVWCSSAAAKSSPAAMLSRAAARIAVLASEVCLLRLLIMVGYILIEKIGTTKQRAAAIATAANY